MGFPLCGVIVPIPHCSRVGCAPCIFVSLLTNRPRRAVSVRFASPPSSWEFLHVSWSRPLFSMRVVVQVARRQLCCSDRARRPGLFVVLALSCGGWNPLSQHPASKDDLQVPCAAAIGWDAPPASLQCCFRPLALALAIWADRGFGSESVCYGSCSCSCWTGEHAHIRGSKEDLLAGRPFLLGASFAQFPTSGNREQLSAPHSILNSALRDCDCSFTRSPSGSASRGASV